MTLKFPSVSEFSFYGTVRGLKLKGLALLNTSQYLWPGLEPGPCHPRLLFLFFLAQFTHLAHPNSDFVDVFDASKKMLVSWSKRCMALIRSKISMSTKLVLTYQSSFYLHFEVFGLAKLELDQHSASV